MCVCTFTDIHIHAQKKSNKQLIKTLALIVTPLFRWPMTKVFLNLYLTLYSIEYKSSASCWTWNVVPYFNYILISFLFTHQWSQLSVTSQLYTSSNMAQPFCVIELYHIHGYSHDFCLEVLLKLSMQFLNIFCGSFYFTLPWFRLPNCVWNILKNKLPDLRLLEVWSRLTNLHSFHFYLFEWFALLYDTCRNSLNWYWKKL